MVKSSELSFEGLVAENVPRRLRSVGLGRVVDLMPHILNGTDPKTGERVDIGREPIDGKQLMAERVYGPHEKDKARMKDNYVVIADSFIGDPSGSGEVLFVRYHADNTVHDLVRSLHPASNLVSGSLPLAEDPSRASDMYSTIKSRGGVLVFPPDVAQALRNDIYSMPNARREFWERMADGDLKLERDYEAMVQKKTGRPFERIMGVYPAGVKGLRPVWVGSVGGDYSDASGDDPRNDNNARLVGVAPEAQAQKIVPATLEDRLPNLSGRTIEIEGVQYILQKK
ncbi:MAG: hypothetical protein V1743_07790 [Nanoarchaeota archaeon]